MSKEKLRTWKRVRFFSENPVSIDQRENRLNSHELVQRSNARSTFYYFKHTGWNRTTFGVHMSVWVYFFYCLVNIGTKKRSTTRLKIDKTGVCNCSFSLHATFYIGIAFVNGNFLKQFRWENRKQTQNNHIWRWSSVCICVRRIDKQHRWLDYWRHQLSSIS